MRHLLQANDQCANHPRQQGMAPLLDVVSPVAHSRQDHFYVCLGHLKDKGFASPVVDPEEAAAKKKKEEMDREIELIKEEYEEKLKKQKNKKKDKEEDKKGKEDKKKEQGNDDDAKVEKEKDEKVSSCGSLSLSCCEHQLTGRFLARSKLSPAKPHQLLRQLQQMIRLVSMPYRSEFTGPVLLRGELT